MYHESEKDAILSSRRRKGRFFALKEQPELRLPKRTYRKEMTAMIKKGMLLLLFFLLTFLTGCHKKNTPLSKTGFYFDTVITVTIYDPSKEDVLDECFALAGYYENLFSAEKEGSDIWNINHADAAPVTVSRETAALLERAVYYSDLTDGLIDPTIAPLSSLWNFSSENAQTHTVPPDTDIAERLAHVDYRNINIDGLTVTLSDADAAVDLGFIAKGYIADMLKEYLLQQQIDSAVIDLGGNVLTLGNKPDGSLYVIGIQMPFADRGVSMGSVSVSDRAVVSSGIYERCFEKDGILYHHILDTDTGYPIDNSLAAVTILAPSSLEADALSTACFALGLKSGKELIESLPDTEALFITKEGEQIATDGFSLRSPSD